MQKELENKSMICTKTISLILDDELFQVWESCECQHDSNTLVFESYDKSEAHDEFHELTKDC